MAIPLIPPHNLDSERAVLGCILMVSETMAVAKQSLTVDSFYHTAHKIIWQTVEKLAEAGKPIDLMLIENELKTINQLDSVGGPGYIASLEQYVLTPMNIKSYCEPVKSLYEQRQLLKLVQEINTNIGEGLSKEDFDELLSKTKGTFDNLTIEAGDDQYKWQCMGDPDFVAENIDRITSGELRGKNAVVSSIAWINRHNRGGYTLGDVTFLCSRPGVAKTCFAIQECINTSKAGSISACFEMELNNARMFERAVKQELGYADAVWGAKDEDGNEIGLPAETKTRLGAFGIKAMQSFKNFFLFYDPELKSRTIDMMIAQLDARGMKPKLVIIDHFHAMHGGTRNQSDVARETELIEQLKMYAGKYQIAFIVIGHPKKESYNKIDLTMDDIRGAGAISGASKLVMMLSRDEAKEGDKDIGLTGKDQLLRLKITKSNEGHTGYNHLVYLWNHRKLIEAVEYGSTERGAEVEETIERRMK